MVGVGMNEERHHQRASTALTITVVMFVISDTRFVETNKSHLSIIWYRDVLQVHERCSLIFTECLVKQFYIPQQCLLNG